MGRVVALFRRMTGSEQQAAVAWWEGWQALRLTAEHGQSKVGLESGDGQGA